MLKRILQLFNKKTSYILTSKDTTPALSPTHGAAAEICVLLESRLWGAFPENVSGGRITGASDSQVVNLRVLIAAGKLEAATYSM